MNQKYTTVVRNRSNEGRGREYARSRSATLPKLRQFSAAYKRRIVREANACQVPGDVGALLRREGLYSWHLTH